MPSDIRRLIIDTDTAADDSFALIVGLLHPKANLEAVTIVAGNVPFEQQVQNALLTIKKTGREGEVPVHLGARVPLTREWVESKAHGDGKGNHDFEASGQRPSDEAAAHALVRLVNENPGEIDIIAIGPLTNIATAVMLDRDFAAKVRELWIMGGCDNSVGNITAAAEYNFYVDPEAADIVLRAGFDTTIATWTLTLAQATWSDEQLEQIATIDNDLARYFTIVNTPNIEYNKTHGIMGSTHPDSVTAMMLVRPDLVKARSRKFVAVETKSDLTRGYSLFDDRPERNAPNATIIDEIDSLGFYEAYVELLEAGPRVD